MVLQHLHILPKGRGKTNDSPQLGAWVDQGRWPEDAHQALVVADVGSLTKVPRQSRQQQATHVQRRPYPNLGPLSASRKFRMMEERRLCQAC